LSGGKLSNAALLFPTVKGGAYVAHKVR